MKQAKSSINTLQESWKHAQQACNAWKVEAEGANTQAQLIEKERDGLVKKMEKVRNKRMHYVQLYNAVRGACETFRE